MINPTHFIEVYANKYESINTNILPIESLRSCIEYTKNLDKLKTIAVWKIKFKEKRQDAPHTKAYSIIRLAFKELCKGWRFDFRYTLRKRQQPDSR